jgi:hypothetical protein
MIKQQLKLPLITLKGHQLMFKRLIRNLMTFFARELKHISTATLTIKKTSQRIRFTSICHAKPSELKERSMGRRKIKYISTTSSVKILISLIKEQQRD